MVLDMGAIQDPGNSRAVARCAAICAGLLPQQPHPEKKDTTDKQSTMSGFSKVHASDAAPAAGPYSHAIKTAGGLIFTSGQLPADKTGGIDLSLSVGEQAELCIANVSAILLAAGSSIGNVVKTTIFLTDMKNFAEVNAVYEKHFQHKPARSCVAVKELPKGVPVEIECIALA